MLDAIRRGAPRRVWTHLIFSLISLAAVASAATPSKSAPRDELSLDGRIQYPGRTRFFYVSLYHVESPFTSTVLADSIGQFHFSHLVPGTYTVAVTRRGLGEIRRSVVVTPAFANKKGVVKVEIPYSSAEAARAPTSSIISAQQLAVPFKATRKYAQAQERLSKHDIPGAAKLVKEALEVFPDFMAAWNFLGVLAFQDHDLHQAEQYFGRAHQVEPQAYEPVVNLGGVLLAEGRPQEALSYNMKALSLRPNDVLASAQTGLSYYQLGEFAEALPYFEYTKAVDPAHFTLPQLYLASIHERSGNALAARLELEDLLARHPDDPNAALVRKRLTTLQASGT